jgi:hypothetical protein
MTTLGLLLSGVALLLPSPCGRWSFAPSPDWENPE